MVSFYLEELFGIKLEELFGIKPEKK